MGVDIPKVVNSIATDEAIVGIFESRILERWVSSNHAEKNHTECKQVSDLAIIGDFHGDFRRHVALRAGEISIFKATAIASFDRTRYSEVRDLDLELTVEENVFQFQVPVGKPFVVDVVDRNDELLSIVTCHLLAKGAPMLKVIKELAPGG